MLWLFGKVSNRHIWKLWWNTRPGSTSHPFGQLVRCDNMVQCPSLFVLESRSSVRVVCVQLSLFFCHSRKTVLIKRDSRVWHSYKFQHERISKYLKYCIYRWICGGGIFSSSKLSLFLQLWQLIMAPYCISSWVSIGCPLRSCLGDPKKVTFGPVTSGKVSENYL